MALIWRTRKPRAIVRMPARSECAGMGAAMVAPIGPSPHPSRSYAPWLVMGVGMLAYGLWPMIRGRRRR